MKEVEGSRGSEKKQGEGVTLERALNVLKGPVLKMTLFLWQKMKATIPITTSSRNRGVRTAMIHRLSGGVFTTAESRPGITYSRPRGNKNIRNENEKNHAHTVLFVQSKLAEKMLISIVCYLVALF